MDAAVPLREQRPRDRVDDDAGAGEEEAEDQQAAHQQRVQAEALGDAPRDTADPPVVGPGDAHAADGVEEAVAAAARRGAARGGGAGSGLGPGRLGEVVGAHGSILTIGEPARHRVLP